MPRFSQHDFTVEGLSALILHHPDAARPCAGSLGFSRPGSAGSPKRFPCPAPGPAADNALSALRPAAGDALC
jgi:hypothetical protein